MPRRVSYREPGDLTARAAAALRGQGVGPGDVVAVLVSIWRGVVVVSLAANRVGAVVNPLMPIFREREMGYMRMALTLVFQPAARQASG